MTSQEESRHRCPCSDSPGPVADEEEVVRLLRDPESFDSKSGALTENAFKTSRMMRTKIKPAERSEVCGDSWGESLQRSAITSGAKLAEMAHNFARKPNQKIAPLAVAKAGEIRAIRHEEKSQEQLLIVLDDGCDGDPGHTVMRARDGHDRSYVQEARRQLLKIFRLKPLPLAEG